MLKHVGMDIFYYVTPKRLIITTRQYVAKCAGERVERGWTVAYGDGQKGLLVFLFHRHSNYCLIDAYKRSDDHLKKKKHIGTKLKINGQCGKLASFHLKTIF